MRERASECVRESGHEREGPSKSQVLIGLKALPEESKCHSTLELGGTDPNCLQYSNIAYRWLQRKQLQSEENMTLKNAAQDMGSFRVLRFQSERVGNGRSRVQGLKGFRVMAHVWFASA